MEAKVTYQRDGSFAFEDFARVFLWLLDESVISTITPNAFELTGDFRGESATATATGSGFTGAFLDGELEVLTGTLEQIDFAIASDSMTFSNIGWDLARLFEVTVALEMTGDPTTLIDEFGFTRLNIRLTDSDDVTPRGPVVGTAEAFQFTLLGNDVLKGFAGNDDLWGGPGADRLEGGRDEDTLDGGAGKDKLFGQAQNDILKGGGGKDFLSGGNGKDVLFGGGGDDVLSGDRGNDILSGGRGFDTYVFADLGGADRVSAFDLDNREKIDLSNVTQIVNFSDLKNNHMDQVGRQTVIDDGAGLRVVLSRIDMDDLGAGDFLF